jgi:N-acetylmuramoyl-L-alanine amidase
MAAPVWNILDCGIGCKNMGGRNNVTEQNMTLKTGLSLNEGTAAGRHLQG